MYVMRSFWVKMWVLCWRWFNVSDLKMTGMSFLINQSNQSFQMSDDGQAAYKI